MVNAMFEVLRVAFVVVLFSLSVSAQASACPAIDRQCQIAAYTKSIESDPKELASFLYRGFLYETQGDYNQAIVDLSKYISSSEVNVDLVAKALARRAACHLRFANHHKAIADLTKAIELDPKNPVLFFERASIFHSLKAYDRAIADLDLAIVLKPDYVVAVNVRGNTYYWKGKRKEAFAEYNKAIALDPDFPDAYLNRAFEFDERKEYAKAINDYNRAIALLAQFPWRLSTLYMNRGISQMNAGNYAEAIKDLTAAISNDPTNPKYYETRAWVHRREGKTALADGDEKEAKKLKY